MTIDTLFGPEEVPVPKPRTIKLKTIKAVYQTITVNDTITDYLKPNTRYTSASQVYDTFSFLRHETKEHFIALHLDGKNRIVCCDMVSTGSLNQSIVHCQRQLKIDPLYRVIGNRKVTHLPVNCRSALMVSAAPGFRPDASP